MTRTACSTCSSIRTTRRPSASIRPRPPPCRRARTWRARASTDRDLAAVAARNRTAGARNPDNQVREAATAEDLLRTPWAVEPLRTGYLPPIGESATCMILAAEGKAEKLCDRPVWIHGVDHRAELQTLGARDLSRSASAQLAGEEGAAPWPA